MAEPNVFACSHCHETHTPPPHAAHDGDAAFCGSCGKWSIWEGKGLRKPSMQELAGLKASDASAEVEAKHRMAELLAQVVGGFARSPSALPQEQFLDISKHTVTRVNRAVQDAAQLLNGDAVHCLSMLMKCIDGLFFQLVANLVFAGCDLDADTIATVITDILREGTRRPEIKQAIKDARAERRRLRKRSNPWP